MNHCRDEQNRPICLPCANKGKGRGELANAANASGHSIYCAECGKEILSVQQSVEARKERRRR